MAGFKPGLKNNLPMEKVLRKTTYHKGSFKTSFFIFPPKFCDKKSNIGSLLNYKNEQNYIQDWWWWGGVGRKKNFECIEKEIRKKYAKMVMVIFSENRIMSGFFLSSSF